jgi:DNA-binding HxlR family transcriptional regulator
MLNEEKFLQRLPHDPYLSTCPIAYGFKILGKRWTIEIVRELLYGRTRFNELLRNVPGISPRMLSLRLRELETNKLVRRNVDARVPVGIEYTLTNGGRDVIPIMYATAKFSMKNFPEHLFSHR